MRYYLSIDSKSYGPYPREDIDAMLREGKIAPDTLAAPEGAQTWAPLSQLLGGSPAAPPPPVPGTAAAPGWSPAGATPATLPKKSNKGLIIGLILGGIAIVALPVIALIMMAVPSIQKANHRARMADDLNNMKQIKLMLDSFAMDMDGEYPNAESHEFYMEGSPAPVTSNDYFQQLFASGNTNSEKVFWVKGASVCNDTMPDDVTTRSGQFDRSETLKPGDCGVAYVLGQENISNSARLLILGAFLAGTTDFDPDLYGPGGNKVLAVHIDGSARPYRLNESGALLDANGDDFLKDAECWDGTPPTVVQPAQ